MQFERDRQSEHWPLFEAVREILLSMDGVIETKKPRITTYRNSNGGICHMRTMPHGIDLGFLKGAKINDTYGVLTGKGKVMRVLPLSELDVPLIRHYLEQANDILSSKTRSTISPETKNRAPGPA